MSKHNNSLRASSKRKCRCGRFMTLGELKAGLGAIDYECPNCFFRKNSKPLTSDEYYEQFNRVFQ